ncbi:metallophosphoesterase [Ammonicoccus fulvus]|uniref:Metallophosphoesterase n=1 Tax=Ammonicoccus fulvus TaxID=3138240 RepID=A0ABZ3FRQ1_9ACTN
MPSIRFLGRALVTLAAVAALALSVQPAHAAKLPRGGNEPIAIFPVVSDIHINSGSATSATLTNALGQFNALAPDMDAFVAVGDLTDYGRADELTKLMGLLDRGLGNDVQRMLLNGNHEYYNGLPTATADQQFLDITRMSSLNQHLEINGLHLIGINYRATADDVAWLRDQLAAAAKADKKAPIFVFFHYPLSDTVYGSEEWGSDNPALYDALKPYPQVITFSGHSHYALEDPRSIMQADFTTVNTGDGLYYMELERGRLQGNIVESASNLHQALLVKAYKNRVEIHRLDIHTGRPTGEPWVIKQPTNKNKFDYTAQRDKVAPVWPRDPRLVAQGTGLRTAKVAFDQASDNLMVHHYEFKAINRDTGAADLTTTAFSEFYRDPVPTRLEFDLAGLTPGATYDLQVTPVDSFGNRGPVRSAEVRTDALELASLTATPEAVSAGSPATVNVNIRNWGPTPASGSVTLTADGPVTLSTTSVDFQVGPNSTATVPVSVTATGTEPAVATVTGTATSGGQQIGSASTKLFVNSAFGESFDSVAPALKPAKDEQIGFLGWTHEGPNGWTVTNSPDMPQGTTEWQGWSFTTPEFWVAADNQDRDKFSLGSGVIAVADPDEWDDRNSPASRGRFDSTLASPEIPVSGGETRTVVFDSHYLQENPQRATVTAVFSDGSREVLVNYGPAGGTDNNGAHAMNQTVSRPVTVPAGATSMRLEFRMFNAGNNWYWGVDNVRVS